MVPSCAGLLTQMLQQGDTAVRQQHGGLQEGAHVRTARTGWQEVEWLACTRTVHTR